LIHLVDTYDTDLIGTALMNQEIASLGNPDVADNSYAELKPAARLMVAVLWQVEHTDITSSFPGPSGNARMPRCPCAAAEKPNSPVIRVSTVPTL